MMKQSVSYKISLIVSILFLISLSFLAWYFSSIQSKALKNELNERAKTLVSNLAYNAEYGVITENSDELNHLISGVLQQKDIIGVSIENKEGKFLAKSVNADVEDQEIYTADVKAQPFDEFSVSDGVQNTGVKSEIVGKVILYLSLDGLNEKVLRLRQTIFTAVLLTLVLLIALLFLVTTYFVHRPLKVLTSGTKKIAEGDLQYRNEIKSKDEIGDLAQSFNNMTIALQSDIKRREEIEVELKESEKKLRTITLAAKDAIIMIDSDGIVSFWNNAACQIFGYSEEEMIGKELHNIVASSESIKKYRLSFQEFKKTGKGNVIGKSLELTAIHKDKTNFPIEVSISAVRIKDQWHAVGLVRDISERKQTEQKLIEAKEIAEVANKAKSEFLANMSHEIRTPLNAVIGFTELLNNIISGEREKSYIESIKTSGKNLLTLINDILDLSKIEAGRLEIQYDTVNPHAIFSELEQIFLMEIQEKGLKLMIDIDKNIPNYLLLDEVRLRQILVNIIGNAIKFTNKGFIRLFATMEYNMKDKSKVTLIIGVQDTGIGIDKNDYENIFAAFMQTQGQKSNEFQGTGLGLSISKRLAEMMGGRIELDSELNIGSTFSLVLEDIPIAAVSQASVKMVKRQTESGVIFSGAKILIVDDIKSNRKLLSEVFIHHNVTIYEAENGFQALDIAKNIIPDIILLDIIMPGMDGFEVNRLLKKEKNLKDIPVLAITAIAIRSSEQKKRESEFNDYLLKPLDIAALLSKLEIYLEKFINEDSLNSNSNATKVIIADDMDIVDCDELFDKLSGELMNKWNIISKENLIPKITEFGLDLFELGKKHQAKILVDYAKSINKYIDQFDTARLKETLAKYSEIIIELKEYKCIKQNKN